MTSEILKTDLIVELDVKKSAPTKAAPTEVPFKQDEPSQVGSFQNIAWSDRVTDALDRLDMRLARTLLAEADSAADADAPECPTWAERELARARIAMAADDAIAAQAILVRAIECDPADPALRTLLSEHMLSNGRAGDVRAVLQHIGKRSAEVPIKAEPVHLPAAQTNR